VTLIERSPALKKIAKKMLESVVPAMELLLNKYGTP
jgi:hypothetical protein